MSNICNLTGKRPATGNNRSHSMRATKRRFMPNVSKKTIIDPYTGKTLKVKISTRAQRSLMKNPARFKSVLVQLAKKKQARVKTKV